MSMPPTYSPQENEPEIYKKWEDSGLFTADPNSTKPHYSIPMPPPNETGTLHIGHALFITLQDILARHARSEGKDVLWLPGTDHAAIATNAVVERILAEENTDKHQIGREAFLERVREYVGNSRNTINKQVRAMGASVDWSRSRYTLDPALSRCVNEVFVRMYNDGLIYRGHRIVNWDPNLETTVSDDEVDYVTENTTLFTFRYGPFEIATARPETKFADKYVVMHPEDDRYKDYREGDTFEAEWINGPVRATVIKDEAIDPSFGTGVMTITPWHSQVDFEIAERHNLDKEQIIGLDGRLLDIAGEFAGMTIAEARPLIAAKLESKGLLVKKDSSYTHNVATNSRGKGVIEPQILLQWFIDVNKQIIDWKGNKLSCKEVLLAVIREGDIKLIPSANEKLYFSWIDNLRDWCISRQIWWGHQVPVWYRGDETYVSTVPPEGEGWERDPDTLDTWFSSSLWTWSTLIDTTLAEDYSLSLEDILKQSLDYQTYHPMSVLETGWDIIFFWVARMILSTTYITGEIPFKDVYLHGMVRSESGKKMSKSNPSEALDPLQIIQEYGTDALRLSLIQGGTAGKDVSFSTAKLITNRNFCNKLWNIARYVTSQEPQHKDASPKTIADHWILRQLNRADETTRTALSNYRFNEAYETLYHFIWDDLADWYLEASKVTPNPELIRYVLKRGLVLLHPMAPYITETIWDMIDNENKQLLASQVYEKIIPADQSHADAFDEVRSIIIEAREISSTLKEPKLTIEYDPNGISPEAIKFMSGISRLNFAGSNSPAGIKMRSAPDTMRLLVSEDKITEHLNFLKNKQQEQQSSIERLRARLSNSSYINKAPKEVVSQTKSQLQLVENELNHTLSDIQQFEQGA